MDYSFTLFTPHREKKEHQNEPLIEIRTNGRIVFNKKATEMLNNHLYCMLGYDHGTKAIGILPLSEKKVNAFPVRYASKGAYIGAKKFFKYFDILPQEILHNPPFCYDNYIGISL